MAACPALSCDMMTPSLVQLSTLVDSCQLNWHSSCSWQRCILLNHFELKMLGKLLLENSFKLDELRNNSLA